MNGKIPCVTDVLMNFCRRRQNYCLDFDLLGAVLMKRKQSYMQYWQRSFMPSVFFVIDTASEALSRYRDRDAIEKLFRTIKTLLGWDTLRVHGTNSAEGKCFLASIIWNEIHQALKAVKKEEKDRKHCTVPAAMKELEKIFVTKDTSGNYQRKYALTAKQKKILKGFDLEEKNLKAYIREISPSLKARSDV